MEVRLPQRSIVANLSVQSTAFLWCFQWRALFHRPAKKSIQGFNGAFAQNDRKFRVLWGLLRSSQWVFCKENLSQRIWDWVHILVHKHPWRWCTWVSYRYSPCHLQGRFLFTLIEKRRALHWWSWFSAEALLWYLQQLLEQKDDESWVWDWESQRIHRSKISHLHLTDRETIGTRDDYLNQRTIINRNLETA